MYSTVVVSFGNGILLLKYIIHTGLPEHTLFYLGSLYFVLWSPTFCLLVFCPFLTFWKFIICSQLTSSWGRMKFRKNEGGGKRYHHYHALICLQEQSTKSGKTLMFQLMPTGGKKLILFLIVLSSKWQITNSFRVLLEMGHMELSRNTEMKSTSICGLNPVPEWTNVESLLLFTPRMERGYKPNAAGSLITGLLEGELA